MPIWFNIANIPILADDPYYWLEWLELTVVFSTDNHIIITHIISISDALYDIWKLPGSEEILGYRVIEHHREVGSIPVLILKCPIIELGSRAKDSYTMVCVISI